MSASEYYDSSGAPSQGASLTSATFRAEFDAVQNGLSAKMPDLAGAAGLPVFIKAGEGGLETKSAAAAQAALGLTPAHGQCRLAKSSANLVLSPLNGNKLMINGVQYAVPAAGVTLTPSGLSGATLYYIYAYMAASVMTLEASATGHSTDATTGAEIKTGDASRSLVGMAYCPSGATFADTDAQRLVASWFNRKPVEGRNYYTAARSTVSTSLVEVNTEIRNQFLTWLGEVARLEICAGLVTNDTGSAVVANSIAIDSTTVAEDVLAQYQPFTNGAVGTAMCALPKAGLAEGFHYATLLGIVSSGTGAWSGGAAGARTVLAGTHNI